MQGMKVDLFGIEYTISFVELSAINQRWGEIDYINHTIKIYKDLKAGTEVVSLLHEFTHNLIYNFAASELDEHKEAICDIVSSGLYAIFKANPALKDIIFGK